MKVKDKLIGARIPAVLKEEVGKYCITHGIKMSFFVTQAVKDKLLEVLEDEDDIKTVSERLKDSEFATAKEFDEYLTRRGIKL